jgi:hypothetical protein
MPECHVHLQAANMEATSSDAANITMNGSPVWTADQDLGSGLYLARLDLVSLFIGFIEIETRPVLHKGRH